MVAKLPVRTIVKGLVNTTAMIPAQTVQEGAVQTVLLPVVAHVAQHVAVLLKILPLQKETDLFQILLVHLKPEIMQ